MSVARVQLQVFFKTRRFEFNKADSAFQVVLILIYIICVDVIKDPNASLRHLSHVSYRWKNRQHNWVFPLFKTYYYYAIWCITPFYVFCLPKSAFVPLKWSSHRFQRVSSNVPLHNCWLLDFNHSVLSQKSFFRSTKSPFLQLSEMVAADSPRQTNRGP